MALRRVHVWERDGRYFWRVRLPRCLAPRLGRAVIAWSLGTREPAEARRRATRATAVFETFAAMLDRAPPLRQPTDAGMMEVLRTIYDDIVLGRESIRAAVLSPSEMKAEGLDGEPPTPEEIALLDRDHDEQSVETWQGYLRDNDLRRVQPLVHEYLDRHDLSAPEHFHLYRTVLRMALTAVVEAKRLNEERANGHYRKVEFPLEGSPPPTKVAAAALMTSR